MDHEITHHQQATLQDYSTYSSTSMAMQSFEPNGEIYGGLHEGIEMLGMMQPPPPPPPFRRAHALSESLMVAPQALTMNPWQTSSRLPLADDSSSRINIFPAIDAGNLQPAASGQLSLTLFHPQPSSSMFQQAYAQHGLSSTRSDQVAAQKAMDVIQGGRLLQSSASSSTLYPEQFLLKNSKYMVPAQQLLNESFNLEATKYAPEPSSNKSKQGEPSSSKLQQLHAMDISELQKRKAKLLALVEEVDKRYKRYCEQTRSVVRSFEAVAGEGAGGAYLALASTVMSRHFRTLRDCIVEQIRAVKKVIEEVDPAAARSTRAETPRLKMIDQYVQQQKAFHQVGMMETHPWRPQRGLPQRAVSILRAWLFEHFLHPYPSDVDKQILSRQTGLSRSQVSNWFINARVRLWKPMVEEMYLEEVKEHDNEASHHDETNSSSRASDMKSNQNPNNLCTSSEQETDEDEKPATAQLLVDSDSLSSIVNNTHSRRHSRKDQIIWENTHGHSTDQLQASSDQGNFGVMDLDFGSYNQCSSEGNYGKGVLLTLGLQQAQQRQDGAGACLSFSPTSRNSQFFAGGEQMAECHGGPFSILDGTQSIPYRNLTETQLLNHFG